MLAQPPDAPFERQRRGVLGSLESAQAEPLHEVGAEQLLLLVAREGSKTPRPLAMIRPSLSQTTNAVFGAG